MDCENRTMAILVDINESSCEHPDDGTTLSFTAGDDAGGRLDVYLAGTLEDFSRARIQGLIKSGNVRVDGTVVESQNSKIRPGSVVDIFIPAPVPAIPEPEDIPLDIIFEDDSILAINKPPGIVTHPAPGHLHGTLVNAILHHCPALSGIGGVARPGIVHRLDMDTSGVMVVAKTEQAMASLTHAFSTHENISKIYLAVIHGRPDAMQGRIENLIGRSPLDRKKMAIVARNGKPAVTNYKIIETNGPLSLAECSIETGRTHQIRVHMASLGTPVAGDTVYGRHKLDMRLAPPPKRQLLHAACLEIRHPLSGAKLKLEAPVPEDFKAYFQFEKLKSRLEKAP